MNRTFGIPALVLGAAIIAGQSSFGLELTFAPGSYDASNNYGDALEAAEVWWFADGKITIAYVQDGKQALGSFYLENFDPPSQAAILKALKLTRDDFDKKAKRDRLAAEQRERDAAAARAAQPKQTLAQAATNANQQANTQKNTKHASVAAMPINEFTFVNPTYWANNAMPGNWRAMSVTPNSKILKLQDKCTVLGYEPQAVHAYFDGKTLQSIEIVLLEQGKSIEEMKMDPSIVEAKLHDMSRNLPNVMKSYFGTEGQVRYQGYNTVLSTKMLQWSFGPNVLWLEIVPAQLISLHILPATEDESYSFMLAATRNKKVWERRADAKANVTVAPNGDHIIANLPIVEQGGRRYCLMGALSMISQYFGTLLSIDSLSAKARYRSDAPHKTTDYYWGIDTIYLSVAQEAKLAVQEADFLDFPNVMSSIDKGCPMIVFRGVNAERDTFQSAFAAEFATNPAATMPIPSNLTSLKWDGHATVINGYNKERDEIIFTESWGEGTRNRRMRFEELKATAGKVVYFEPEE